MTLHLDRIIAEHRRYAILSLLRTRDDIRRWERQLRSLAERPSISHVLLRDIAKGLEVATDAKHALQMTLYRINDIRLAARRTNAD